LREKNKLRRHTMSKYFDEKHQWVREDFDSIDNVEAGIIDDVNLVTGDREFPEEMRERIQGIIACNRHQCLPGLEDLGMSQGGKMSEITRSSRLISELHSAFHDLAGMRIRTSYGRLDDSPEKILKRRGLWERD
jgi:hypothetical protein